jgi:hypothetical protein
VRTAIIILAGLALLAICVGIARLLSSDPARMGSAIAIFVVIWFLVAAGNMWVGVTRAGYSVREELPIFLIIFLVPAAAAALVRWKLR